MLSSLRLPRRAAALGVAALATAGAATALADGPHTLATPQEPTVVAAYHGVVMWSERDSATGAFQLMQSADGGAPTKVNVPQRPEGPFDVDLGTNRSASTYAVYTREGIIYRLSVKTGVEQRLESISLGGHNISPTIQRGRIGFVHADRGHDQIRVGGTTRAEGTPKLLVKGTIDDVELGNQQIAYTESERNGTVQRVHIRNITTGRDQVLYRAASGGANQAHTTRPTFDTEGFYWARTNNGSGTGNRFIRYTLRGSKLSYAQGTERHASTAWAGDALGMAYSDALDPATNDGCSDAGVQYCSVGTSGTLTWGTRP